MAYLQVRNTVGNQNDRRPELDSYSTTLESWQEALKLVPLTTRLWLPFFMNGDSGRIVRGLGYTVIESPPYTDGGDFYTYQPNPNDYDMIVDNPPFSKKEQLLTRLHAINKPFIIFYPYESILQLGVRRHDRIHHYALLLHDKYFSFAKRNEEAKPMKNICLYCYDKHPEWKRLKLPIINERMDYISNYYGGEYVDRIFDKELTSLLQD